MRIWNRRKRTTVIDTTVKQLKVIRGDVAEFWQYSVVQVYVHVEQLEKNHSTKKPTEPLIADLAEYLDGIGLVGCTPQIAEQMYRLAKAQMFELLTNFESQLKGKSL